MKKITLLTAAALSVTALSFPAMTAEAGSFQVSQAANKNAIVIKGNNCPDLQSVLKNLQNCFPNLQIPNVPDQSLPTPPNSNVPDNSLPTPPDSNVPDNSLPTPPDNTPEVNPPEQNPSLPEQPDSQLGYAEQVAALVNEERAKEGLSPLSIKTDVAAAAQVRTSEIQSSFSHTRPDGSHFSTALKEQNVSYRGAGENIAWGQKSPEQVMDAWMNSEGHRANIMNKNFTSIGVGYEQVNGVNYWVQLFTY